MNPDPTSLAERLLAHHDFVRGLARRLLADEHAAEDLAQDTWLAALRRTPDDAGRPWLATIVRNLGRNRRRDDALRVRRERQAVRDDWVVPTAAVVEREHARREVVDAVLALDEPYRSTVLLRFFDGLSAAEIARRAGTNAATVRSRLSRGLDRLRERLDAEHGGDRRAWVVALVPWARSAGVRAGVLAVTATIAMKTKVLLLGAAIAAVITWIALPGSGGVAPGGTPSDGGTARVAARQGVVADGGRGPTSAASAVRTAVPDAAAGVAHRVRVVRQATAEALGGAEVLFDATGVDEDGFRADRVAGLAAAEGPGGVRLVTGADGTVDVPAPDADGYPVFARLGALFGTARVTAGEALVEVVVEPDRAFDVVVLDAEDIALADVEVVLAEPDDQGELTFFRMKVRTDRAGRARFEHAQVFAVDPARRSRLAVGVSAPMRVRVTAPIDLERLADAPTVLRVPPAASLTVTFVDESGMPFVPRRGEWMDVGVVLLGDGLEMRRISTFVGTPQLELPFVEVGARFRLSMSSERASAAAEFVGPIRPGEHARVDVVVARRPIVTGRLLDSAGVPLVDFDCHAKQIGRLVGSWHSWIRTDGSARFELLVPTLFGNPMAGRRLVFGDSRGQIAEVSLSAIPDVYGVHDLGDLRLGPPPVLIQGLVVDTRGSPIAGAAVRLQESDGASIWEAHAAEHAESDAEGRFAVRGVLAAASARLIAEKAGFRDHIDGAPPLGGEVRIVLRGAGTIRADVGLGGIDPSTLVVTLIEAATGARRTMSFGSMVRDRMLTFTDVEEGSASVLLEAAGVLDPVCAWRDIAVVAGEVTTLEPADLASRVAPLRLTVVDRDGRAVPGAVAWTDPDRPRDGSWAALRTTVGRIVLNPSALPTDVAIAAPGYRRVVLRRVARDQQVVLDRGVPVTVELDGPAWSAGTVVELRLEPAGTEPGMAGQTFYRSPQADPYVVAGGDGGWHAIDRLRVERAGRFTLHACVAGPHVVRVVGDPDGGELDWLSSDPIEVGNTPRTLRIAWTEDALRRLPAAR